MSPKTCPDDLLDDDIRVGVPQASPYDLSDDDIRVTKWQASLEPAQMIRWMTILGSPNGRRLPRLAWMINWMTILESLPRCVRVHWVWWVLAGCEGVLGTCEWGCMLNFNFSSSQRKSVCHHHIGPSRWGWLYCQECKTKGVSVSVLCGCVCKV